MVGPGVVIVVVERVKIVEKDEVVNHDRQTTGRRLNPIASSSIYFNADRIRDGNTSRPPTALQDPERCGYAASAVLSSLEPSESPIQ